MYRHVVETMRDVARQHDPERYRVQFLALVTSNR